MTARPRTVAAAALALAAGLCGAPVAAAVGCAGPGCSVAAPVAETAALGVVRSDPRNGSWTQRPPQVARLWFASGAAARAADVRISTPLRTAAKDLDATVSGIVLSLRVPDDGPGDYRVVWYVPPNPEGTDGAAGAAGMVTFRVGGSRPQPLPTASATSGPAQLPAASATPGTRSFTIPDRPATSAPPADGPTAGSGPTSAPSDAPSDAPTAITSTSTTTPDLVPEAGAGATAAPPAPPADRARIPGRLVPDPAGLALTALAGLLACAVTTRWSWRRAIAEGLRAR